MRKTAIKFLFAFLFFLPLAAWAVIPDPPSLPVFYYGNVTIDGSPAALDTLITIKKVADNSEWATTSPRQTGKYYYEMPCSEMVGENLFFSINGNIAGETVCPDVASTASVNLNLILSPEERMANQWTSSTTFPSTLAPDAEAKVSFTPTASGTDKQVTIGAGGFLIKREATDPNYRFEINFPAGTVITGSSTWDGSIIAPTIKPNTTVTVPSDPGKLAEVLETIEIGFSGEHLIFDQPVSILLPGQTGRRVGYSRNGGDFTEITNVCPANNGASLVGGVTECKFDNGVDLYIWTKHFTFFTTFAQNPLPPPSGSSGGSYQSTASCSSVEYSDWGVCKDGKQARTAVSKQPGNCEMSQTEKNSLERACVIEEEKNGSEEEKNEEEKKDNGVVLGEKIYKDGSLISGSDRKIYYIENQKRRWIVDLIALRKFKGKKVNIVTDFTIYAYPAGAPIFGYTEGDLIRGKDKKIYHIEKGQKVYVRSLAELRKKFFGRPIINI
ncbi:MAG: hypothetical protein WCW77_02750 [Patescibacteria group bacterium]|jgi:hypothetical protein